MTQKITEAVIRLPFLVVALGLIGLYLLPLGNADPPVEDKPTEVISQPVTIAAPAPEVIQDDSVRRCANGYIYSDEIPLSDGWQCYTQEQCRLYGVDYALMLGLMETESSFREDADSGWAYGLCQIGYINEDGLAELGMDIYTNQGNIAAGCYMMADLLERYEDPHLALMAYNCGETYAAELWAEGQTASEYSRNVQAAAERWADALR